MTALTLNTPEARRALGRCVRLLLQWADEADENDAPGSDYEAHPGASSGQQRSDHRGHATSKSVGGQVEVSVAEKSRKVRKQKGIV